MSALNVILGRYEAYILTDTAIYRPSGEIVGFAQKCYPAPGTGMAVASRGDVRFPQAIAQNLGRFYSDIDELIDDKGAALAEAYDETIAGFDVVLSAKVNIAIVGFSERRLRMAGITLCFDGSWVFKEIDGGIMAPLPDKKAMRELHLQQMAPDEHYGADDFLAEVHGVFLMEAQRRMKFAPFVGISGVEIHLVGGEVLLTTVSREGVDQRTIHSWPDEAGVTLRPAPFSAPVPLSRSAAPVLNRQQRRALERQGRLSA